MLNKQFIKLWFKYVIPLIIISMALISEIRLDMDLARLFIMLSILSIYFANFHLKMLSTTKKE